MFSKVIISADILRPFPVGSFYESATKKNIRWLDALLKQPLQEANIDVSMLAWDENQTDGNDFFDTPALYQALGIPLNLASWAKLTANDCAPEPLIEMLRKPLAHALVIGYEIPDVIMDALKVLGTPFIDIVLHPLRFLPDLVFSFRSNIAEFQQVFEKYRLEQYHVGYQVSLLLAKNAWMNKPEDITLPPGSTVILQQVSSDIAVVMKDGNFASLENHIPRLHQIVSDHPAVFFKPHPYAMNQSDATWIKKNFPSIRFCNTNWYHLIMQQEIEKVVALNSSGLIEAKAFGKEAENLIPWKYHHNETFTPKDGLPGALIPLNDSWLMSHFWKDLFNGKNTPLQRVNKNIWQPNRLRRSMNADWGYSFINNVVI